MEVIRVLTLCDIMFLFLNFPTYLVLLFRSFYYSDILVYFTRVFGKIILGRVNKFEKYCASRIIITAVRYFDGCARDKKIIYIYIYEHSTRFNGCVSVYNNNNMI